MIFNRFRFTELAIASSFTSITAGFDIRYFCFFRDGAAWESQAATLLRHRDGSTGMEATIVVSGELYVPLTFRDHVRS